MEAKIPKVKLSNGVEMPIQGYGVYQIKPEETEQCVLNAIKAGYRAIDTASAYMNEEAVGNAIKKCGLKREELFITTKVFVHEAGYEKAKEAFERSLKKLQLDYIDLYLIHQPFGDYYGTWRALEELYEAKKIRAIGVSNFYGITLHDFCRHVKILPMVNQIEFHPFWQRKNEMAIMKKYNIAPESWASLAEFNKELIGDPTIAEIAKKHSKKVPQIILKFLTQLGVIIIPKTVHEEYMKENIDIWDFTLDDDDMNKMKGLDRNKAFLFNHQDFDTMEQFFGLLENFSKMMGGK